MPRPSPKDIRDTIALSLGICMDCGAKCHDAEDDAEEAPCDECGARAVKGWETLGAEAERESNSIADDDDDE